MIDIKPRIVIINDKPVKLHKVTNVRPSYNGPDRRSSLVGTFEELHEWHSYTLETGRDYQHEKGNRKISIPKTFKSLVANLNKAKDNAAANGYSPSYYVLDKVTDEDIENYLKK